VTALLHFRRLAREFGWTWREVLETPAQLVRDLLAASSLEAQLR
jgi:hypothetical protein